MMSKILVATDNSPNYLCDNLNKFNPSPLNDHHQIRHKYSPQEGAKAIIIDDADETFQKPFLILEKIST